MKHKKVAKIGIVFALATSILTNSVGNMFAKQEQQVEETISEEYKDEVKKIEDEIIVAEEKEDSLEDTAPLMEEKEEVINQEVRASRYTLSREKFRDMHVNEGAHTGDPGINAVEFIDGPLPEGATSVDLSEDGDGSVMGAKANGVLTVTTNTPGVKVKFPWDSSYLFAKVVSESLDGAVFRAISRNYIDLTNVDTSNVNSMKGMFGSIQDITSLDLSTFDTKNVVNMSSMFAYSEDLTDIDFSTFDTRKVTGMTYMFLSCRSLTSLDLSHFETPNLKDTSHMFSLATSLQSLDLSNFDTSKVYTMETMFNQCRSLKELNLRNFDTSNVKDMNYMFRNCRSLTALDLSNFNTSNVRNMESMFRDCSSLTTLDISNFNTEKVEKIAAMFANCNSLTELNLSSFNTPLVTNMAEMFNGCSSLTTIYSEEWDTSQVTSDTNMFLGCEKVVGKSEYAITTPFDPNRIGKEVATPNNGYFTVPNLEEWNATVKYVDEDNQVVATKDFLTTNRKAEITTEKLNEFMPNGYELVDENASFTVTQDGQVFEVEVRKIQWTLELEYQTVDGTVVKTEVIQVTQLNPVVTAQTISEKVPTGYELVDAAADWTATANGEKKIIQVREIQWIVNLEYQTVDGSIVKTEAIQVTQLNPVVTAQVIIEKVPTGYELVDPAIDWTATSNGEKKVIQVRAIEWTVSLEYQTVDGAIIKEEQIQVTQLNPVVTAQVITEKVPTGYELVDPAIDWTATSNGEKKVIQVRAIEWTVSLEYQTVDGAIIKEEQIQVTQLNPVVTAQVITEKVPTGYELVDPAIDWTATSNGDKKIIQIRAIEWTVELEYQTTDGAVIKEETIQVTQLNPVVTAQTISEKVPTGYELVDPATDWTVASNGEKKVIQVREIEWTIMVEFVTENSRGVVETVTFTVGNLNPVIEAQQIIDVLPEGYYAVNEIQNLIATKDGEVFQVVVVKIEDWEGIVHFVDQNGVTVKTEVYKVTNKEPMIRVEELEKVVPVEATLVNPLTELTVTKDKEEFIIEVIMPVEEQPGVDDDTTDEVQPEGSVEGVQTGDATQMGLWTILMGGSIGVLAYLKRKKKNLHI
ncbi:MAG: BspA family leucine-rich repeat surface protein [Erysipelotrichaceae bacterium]|nr:BspA family leucine-rich repeat surface protein [Erysipelotrichaceae bacterium]